MAWCYYKDLRRKKGAMLRTPLVPKNILEHVPKTHTLEHVVIDHRERDGRVILEVWSTSPEERKKMFMPNGGPYSYTVTILAVPEDPDWIIERY